MTSGRQSPWIFTLYLVLLLFRPQDVLPLQTETFEVLLDDVQGLLDGGMNLAVERHLFGLTVPAPQNLEIFGYGAPGRLTQFFG